MVMVQPNEIAASREFEWWSGPKARVFVSCGQATAKECALADAIADELRKREFAAYVGIQTHSSMGLNENIYRHLTTAEYIIFIDFPDQPPDYHFSLFSHQEMAIASYVGADLLAFHPEGQELAGLLKFMQGNSTAFKNPEELPELVLKTVRGEGWNNRHRRELRLEASPQPPATAGLPGYFLGQIPPGEYRYFELILRNLHSMVMATDCTVQIVDARGPSYNGRPKPDLVEMKFRYMVKPSIVLPPSRSRQVDGVIIRAAPGGDRFMPLACPGILNPGHIDSGQIVAEYIMRVPGDHELDLEVHSREFGTQRATVLFHFDANPDKCRISVDPPHGPPITGLSVTADGGLRLSPSGPSASPQRVPQSGVMPMQPGTLLPPSPMPDPSSPR